MSLRKAYQGSSPLARGPQQALFCQHAEAGLIPARAGTTLPGPVNTPVLRAHPRSRGDHRGLRDCTITVLGSSPLARGPLLKRAGTFAAFGLIPARAGTTVLIL